MNTHSHIPKMKASLVAELSRIETQAKMIRKVLAAFSTMNGAERVQSVHVYRNRVLLKCKNCGKPFKAFRMDAKYCHNPCKRNSPGSLRAGREAALPGKPDSKPRRRTKRQRRPKVRLDSRGRIVTPGRIAAAAKARAALAAKRAKKAETKARHQRGVTLIPGDPLTAAPATA